MKFAIRLKTSLRVKEKINEKILDILEHLGLELQVDTFVKNLSGGQKKRLSIAMELVDNPSILFLDEPTTGLDSVSTSQCVKLMKKLALEGKTVICTIHQPSALIFEVFDHLYALVDGKCIYQGTPKNLVSFLAEIDLVCPESYNPADYLLEIATDGYGDHNDLLTKKIENGVNENYREPTKTTANSDSSLTDTNEHEKSSASFCQQVFQLLKRNTLFNIRNKSFAIIRIIVHAYIGVLVGLMYFNIGNQAKQMINIYKSFLVLTIVLMYTSIYSLLVRCKLKSSSSYLSCSPNLLNFQFRSKSLSFAARISIGTTECRLTISPLLWQIFRLSLCVLSCTR
jgi:ABC-type sugar transport system ATPase subunit